MKFSELVKIVNLHKNHNNTDYDIRIVVKMPFDTIGGTPSVPVKSAYFGFDWDSGKFLIYPEENLMEYDVDFGEKFRELQKKNGDLQYENRGLKSEVKRLKKLLQDSQNSV
jgi:hypothetical protein